MNFKYDYLIIGAGLFGCTFAHLMHKATKKCLIIDKNSYIGGLCYTENVDGIMVHKFGPHIFHTKNKKIWDFINQFDEFNNYTHRVKARYDNRLYSFPINLQTFYELYGIESPKAASSKNIDAIKKIFYLEYTKKVWGPYWKDVYGQVIKRIPIRYNFNDSYYGYNEYQGIPKHGYTCLMNNMIEGVDIQLDANYFDDKDYYDKLADKIVYTGKIDALLDYKYSRLPYRSLHYEEYRVEVHDLQGISQLNYVDDTTWTRVIEHKHFTYQYDLPYTIYTCELPEEEPGIFSYGPIEAYPVETEENMVLYNKYREELDSKYIIGGRMGEYKYMNMDQVVYSAIKCIEKEKEY